MYFVICLEKNTEWGSSIERIAEAFTTLERATSYADIWRNKGWQCTIYQGLPLIN